jgi:hypothetical protein
MALHALNSCMDFLRVPATYHVLVGISGSAFKFVYDSTEAYEPLRDIMPVDILRSASSNLGFTQARWETGWPVEIVRDVVRDEIDSGRPVIAPFLDASAYHGFFIITGYDLDRNVFYVQGAFESGSTYVEVPVPAGWDGPTVSPAGWARNPVFVLGERSEKAFRAMTLDRNRMAEARMLLEGGSLEYGSHIGEERFMRHAGPHRAGFGLPAYDLAAYDLAHRPLVVERDGSEVLDFGLIWRIDSQFGQLQHDRGFGSTYLRQLGAGNVVIPSETRSELIRGFERTAGDAWHLRRLFWDTGARGLSSSREALRYIRDSRSLVFAIGDDPELHDDMRAQGFGVYGSPWGWVAVDDSPEKRVLARVSLKSIVTRERGSLSIVKRIEAEIEAKREEDRNERRRRRELRRQPGG